MGSCSVTMGTEFAALNPGLRRCISMSHAWHLLLLARGFSQEAMDCGALISFGPRRNSLCSRDAVSG